ncbi:MAG: aspartyl/glutamyl-tRNA(Asn/Gln) amidotransferase subunit [Planctomycetota bacterium]|jgi:aspartyl-tRNA(Asn)/glutamyl-tRNA(Gln) amidotransferase subunit C
MTPEHSLTTQEVAHVARLARLAIPADRLDDLRGELSSVLGHVARLKTIPVEGVEPMTTPFELVNRLDPDEPGPCMDIQDLLRNAPAVEGRYLAVPKVLAEES